MQSGDKDQMTTENAAQVPSFKSIQKTSALILNCLLTSAPQLSYLLSIYYFFPALVDTSSTKRGILTTWQRPPTTSPLTSSSRVSRQESSTCTSCRSLTSFTPSGERNVNLLLNIFFKWLVSHLNNIIWMFVLPVFQTRGSRQRL